MLRKAKFYSNLALHLLICFDFRLDTLLLVGWNKTLIWLSCKRPAVRDEGLAKRKNSDDPILVNP